MFNLHTMTTTCSAKDLEPQVCSNGVLLRFSFAISLFFLKSSLSQTARQEFQTSSIVKGSLLLYLFLEAKLLRGCLKLKPQSSIDLFIWILNFIVHPFSPPLQPPCSSLATLLSKLAPPLPVPMIAREVLISDGGILTPYHIHLIIENFNIPLIITNWHHLILYICTKYENLKSIYENYIKLVEVESFQFIRYEHPRNPDRIMSRRLEYGPDSSGNLLEGYILAEYIHI